MVKNNSYIIDSSYMLAFLLPDENLEAIEATFEDYKKGTIKLISCNLLRYEIGNSLRTAVTRLRITKKQAQQLMNYFLELPIIYEEINAMETLKLSLKHELSFYDSSYLSLSQDMRIPLLTLDNKLIKI